MSAVITEKYLSNEEWRKRFSECTKDIQKEYNDIWAFINKQLMNRNLKCKVIIEIEPIKIGDKTFAPRFQKEIEASVYWECGDTGYAFIGARDREGQIIEDFQDDLQKEFQTHVDDCIKRIERWETDSGLEWG